MPNGADLEYGKCFHGKASNNQNSKCVKTVWQQSAGHEEGQKCDESAMRDLSCFDTSDEYI